MSVTQDWNDWNRRVIEEFRTNGGKVSGRFEGGTLLLLHHVGRRSGAERVNPLAYLRDGDRYVVIGSKGGAPTHPDWYHNLVAARTTEIEVGTERFPVEVHELTGTERDEVWPRLVEAMPGFGDYQRQTDRTIPLVALSRVA